MIQKIIKRTVFVLLTISLILSAVFICYAESAYSWYTKREKDNRQPKLDKGLSLIDGYNVSWLDSTHGDSCEEKVLYLTFDF